MEILNEILKSLKTLPLDEKMKIVCDKIQTEENKFIMNKDDIPNGPNIFLSVECPGITKQDICFVCLERDMPGKYFLSIWTKQKNGSPIKRTKVDLINELAVEKILLAFAERIKLMRGE